VVGAGGRWCGGELQRPSSPMTRCRPVRRSQRHPFRLPSLRRHQQTPLIFFQHFMGNLDDHDPALSDDFAGDHEVILFNNTGVASTNGTAPWGAVLG
jgi:hypothetical protein